jgi:hypothetical protein
MLPPLGSGERTAWALALFAISAGLAHLIHAPLLAFITIPMTLALVGSGIQGYLWASLAGYMTFFQGFSKFSNVGALNVPDSLLFAYLIIVFAKGDLSLRLKWPASKFAWSIYAFAFYALFMSLPMMIEISMADTWYYRDVKNTLQYFLFIPLVLDKTFGVKSAYRLLLWICVFTSIHAIFSIGEYIAVRKRIVTWNEIFFSDVLIMSVVLLPVFNRGYQKWLLRISLAAAAGGLIAGQTRGLWLSTAGSLLLLFLIPLFKTRKATEASPIRILISGFLFVLILGTAFKLSTDHDLIRFVKNRMTEFSPYELIDPNSSLGYRIHESLAVWEKRTWLGHGSGGRIRLLFTQFGEPKMMDWWSIHSEYFEMLHKYGFIGLILFVFFHIYAALKSARIWLKGSALLQPLGAISCILIINHAVISITAGFLIRENVMGLMVLLLVIAEKFDRKSQRTENSRENEHLAPSQGPAYSAQP